ncbi:hypothetical protein KAW43_00560 [Candidatus Parcubacteria bacterium]|nr:hypothetical protein [Candidatus Parcubacteria bacterium]
MAKGIKSLILIIGIGAAALIFTNDVFAQEKGIGISPLTFELTASSGDVLTNTLKVYNPTDSTIGIKIEVEDFTATGEMGQVIIEPAETETYSLAGWIRTEPETFILGSKEQKFVDFTINVPENAEPGGHYGSILASTAGVIGEKITGATVAQKVGALVLLTVSGEIREELIVKDFSCPSFLETGPVDFTIRFENRGTVHLRPRGFVVITDWRGKKAADIVFPQNNIMPGAVRKIEASWDKKWLAGRYTAVLVGGYGTSNISFNSSVLTFWVFPWKLALIIFVALMMFIIFFYKTRKRWRLAMKILIKGEGK